MYVGEPLQGVSEPRLPRTALGPLGSQQDTARLGGQVLPAASHYGNLPESSGQVLGEAAEVAMSLAAQLLTKREGSESQKLLKNRIEASNSAAPQKDFLKTDSPAHGGHSPHSASGLFFPTLPILQFPKRQTLFTKAKIIRCHGKSVCVWGCSRETARRPNLSSTGPAILAMAPSFLGKTLGLQLQHRRCHPCQGAPKLCAAKQQYLCLKRPVILRK